MSSEKEFEKNTNILPFQQRKEEKFKSSAMLVAIDLQSNALGLSEDALTKLLEDKLDASILACRVSGCRLTNAERRNCAYTSQ